MRQLWTTGTATLDGKHYQVDGAISRPLPLQEGGIPLWVAGGGEKKTLRIAAQHARYTNFDGSLEGFRHKSEVLEGHCRDIGRDFDEIVRSANYNVFIGRDEAEVADRLRTFEERRRPYLPAEVLASTVQQYTSTGLVGTPEQIVDRLESMQKAGMTYAIANFHEAAYDDSGIRLYAEQVVPALS